MSPHFTPHSRFANRLRLALLRRPAWLLALPLGLFGCATATAEPSDAATGDGDTAAVHAFLSVDRSTEPGAASASEGLGRQHASATFLRTHDGADPRVVARLLGAVPTLPAAGACAPLDAEDPGVVLHALSPVELMQAGDVALGGEHPTSLVARAYPDVAHLVSGVVYTTADVTEPEPRERLVFQVAGSSDVPGFSVDLDLPRPVTGLRLNDVELRRAGDLGACPGCGRDPLLVTWALEASDASADSEDLVYVDLSAGEGGERGQLRVRCTSLDAAGPVRVAAPLGAPAGSVLDVTVHRLRTVRFSADGLSTGEVRLDTAVTGRISLADPS